ncbi:hypothetical protein Ahia01_000647900, partial [Argonauta hians]
KNYKASNNFSQHDNRNIFDLDWGHFARNKQYKRVLVLNEQPADAPLCARLFGTPDSFPKTSTYAASFQRFRKVSNGEDHRRFPRKYPEPRPGSTKLNTANVTLFNPKGNFEETNRVIINALPNHRKKSSWKSFYKGAASTYQAC